MSTKRKPIYPWKKWEDMPADLRLQIGTVREREKEAKRQGVYETGETVARRNQAERRNSNPVDDSEENSEEDWGARVQRDTVKLRKNFGADLGGGADFIAPAWFVGGPPGGKPLYDGVYIYMGEPGNFEVLERCSGEDEQWEHEVLFSTNSVDAAIAQAKFHAGRLYRHANPPQRGGMHVKNLVSRSTRETRETVARRNQAKKRKTSPVRCGPRFVHDCDLCVFLFRDGDVDVWVCPAGEYGRPPRRRVAEGSLIRRFGSDAHEYASVDVGVLTSLTPQNSPEMISRMKRRYGKALTVAMVKGLIAPGQSIA